MSELNITEMLNQTVLEFGNERFLEGWNGQQERIIKLLEAEQAKAGQSLDADAEFYTGLKLAITLIKGEK